MSSTFESILSSSDCSLIAFRFDSPDTVREIRDTLNGSHSLDAKSGAAFGPLNDGQLPASEDFGAVSICKEKFKVKMPNKWHNKNRITLANDGPAVLVLGTALPLDVDGSVHVLGNALSSKLPH